MSIQGERRINIITVFLWIGFVSAISFMEAWLKFQAPGITLALDLGIGRLVFGVLNKVEWIYALTILFTLLVGRGRMKFNKDIFILPPLLILIVQTSWLLPALDARAALYVDGQSVPPSNLHLYYIGIEAVKVIALTIFGTRQFNNEEKKNHNTPGPTFFNQGASSEELQLSGKTCDGYFLNIKRVFTLSKWEG